MRSVINPPDVSRCEQLHSSINDTASALNDTLQLLSSYTYINVGVSNAIRDVSSLIKALETPVTAKHLHELSIELKKIDVAYVTDADAIRNINRSIDQSKMCIHTLLCRLLIEDIHQQ